MSRSSSRMPGASISNSTAGCWPRSGLATKVSMAPSWLAISKVSSRIGDPPTVETAPLLSVAANGAAHGRADFGVHREVGQLVLLGRLTVDDDEARAVVFGQDWETGSRVDHQRAAEHDKQVCRQGQLVRPFHGSLWHGLPERDGCGLDHAAAGCAERQPFVDREDLLHPIEFVAATAVEAGGIGGVAVQFNDLVLGDA